MNVKIRPISNKFKILYRKARYKVLYGGRSSGKSWAVAEALVHYAMNHKLRILCAREIQKAIKDSSYQLILDTIERLELSEFFDHTNSEIICLQTGTRFIFRGVKSDPQGLKGLEGIDICWVEEAQTISKESIDILRPTLRKRGSEIWFTYNPRLPSDYVSVMFQTGKNPRNTLIEKVNYYDNTEISQETLDEIQDCREYDEDEYRHIWLGEYQEESDDLFIPLRIAVEAQKRKPQRMQVPIIAGVDVARYGKDRSAIVIRQGPAILHVELFEKGSTERNPRKGNTTDLKAKIVSRAMQWKVDTLVVDGGGLGGPIVDDLIELLPNVNVIDFVGAGRVQEQPKKGTEQRIKSYLNARAESWGNMKDWLIESGCVPTDLTLQNQLTTIRYKVTNNNQIQLESKEDLKGRGLPSPDIADALAQTFAGAAKCIIDPDKVKGKLYRKAA